MATYSDSMLGYADFRSTGRYFAIALAACALVGVTATYAANGHLPRLIHDSSDLVFVAFVGYVALGLSVVLALVVLGSLLISRRAQLTISVSPLGVEKKGDGNDAFLPRDRILGMIEMRSGFFPRPSITLVDADTGRQMLIPSSLARYGACLSELEEMGIATLPPFRRSAARIGAAWGCRVFGFCGLMLIVHGTRPPILQLSHLGLILGGLILVALSAWSLQWLQRNPGRFGGARPGLI